MSDTLKDAGWVTIELKGDFTFAACGAPVDVKAAFMTALRNERPTLRGERVLTLKDLAAEMSNDDIIEKLGGRNAVAMTPQEVLTFLERANKNYRYLFYVDGVGDSKIFIAVDADWQRGRWSIQGLPLLQDKWPKQVRVVTRKRFDDISQVHNFLETAEQNIERRYLFHVRKGSDANHEYHSMSAQWDGKTFKVEID